MRAQSPVEVGWRRLGPVALTPATAFATGIFQQSRALGKIASSSFGLIDRP